jgi:precorrin isomerase
MSLEIDDAIDLIETIWKKEEEDVLLRRWIAHFQHISFLEFKESLQATVIQDDKTQEEILMDVASILGGVKHGDI